MTTFGLSDGIFAPHDFQDTACDCVYEELAKIADAARDARKHSGRAPLTRKSGWSSGAEIRSGHGSDRGSPHHWPDPDSPRREWLGKRANLPGWVIEKLQEGKERESGPGTGPEVSGRSTRHKSSWTRSVIGHYSW